MHNEDYKNLKFKYLTDDVTTDFWFFKIFANMRI